MSATTEAAPPPTCIVCGYDLRASPPEGRCPECGAAVERSLHGDWLRYADQDWLRAVHLGLEWMWTSLAIALSAAAAVLVSVTLDLFTDPLSRPAPLNWLIGFLVMLVLVGALVAASGFPIGLILLTSQEPRLAPQESRRALILRAVSIGLLPALVSPAVGAGWASVLIALPPWGGLLLAVVASLLIGTHACLLLDHARFIERRCAGFDEERMRLLGKYRRGVIGFTIVIIVLLLLMHLSTGSSAGSAPMIIVWIAAVSQIGKTRLCVRAEMDMHIAAGPRGAG